MMDALIEILKEVKEKFTDDSDMMWTSYGAAREVRDELDMYIQQLNKGDNRSVEKVYAYFRPAFDFQEHAIQNGWSAEYMKLSEEFDHIYEQMKDSEVASYIITYFRELMTDFEKIALNHYMYMAKTSDNPRMRSILISKGWIISEPGQVERLASSWDEFELTVVQRIMAETPEKVFFNNCPVCKKLARTPYAKQCRHCGHNWHNK